MDKNLWGVPKDSLAWIGLSKHSKYLYKPILSNTFVKLLQYRFLPLYVSFQEPSRPAITHAPSNFDCTLGFFKLVFRIVLRQNVFPISKNDRNA